MKHKKTRLPKSLRKYIREQKSKIRRQYGLNSAEEKKFFIWIIEEKQKNFKRVNYN